MNEHAPFTKFSKSPILRVCVRYYMRMRNQAWLLLAASALSAQPLSPSPPQTAAAAAGQVPGTAAPEAPARPAIVGTMSDLMVKVIYPASDAIFYITTRQPTSEAEWVDLQGKALMVAESANLLMMPGRARDEDRWMQDAKLMLDAGRAAYRAARAKDLAALEALNDQLLRVVHQLPPALSSELRPPSVAGSGQRVDHSRERLPTSCTVSTRPNCPACPTGRQADAGGPLEAARGRGHARRRHRRAVSVGQQSGGSIVVERRIVLPADHVDRHAGVHRLDARRANR